MKTEKPARLLREGAAVLLLVLIGVGAWRSIPTPRNLFDPAQLVINQFFTRERNAPFTPPTIHKGEIYGAGVRLQPGGAMEFDLARWQGVLWCRFQTVAPEGATIEVTATNATQTTLVTRRQLNPQASQADGQPFLLLVDPAALPTMNRLVLGVSAASAGSVDWTEIRLAKDEDLTVQRTAPFRFLAFDGLYAPLGEDKAVYVHAPAAVSLVIPAGRRQFHATFGYNPSVVARPDSASDGLGFELILDSPGSTRPLLLQRLLQPGSRSEDRTLQQITATLENSEASVLRLVVDPGRAGNIAWDSAVWRDFIVEENPGP